ncbi:MAG: hypothetical protein SVU32_02025, partial [Candidatus Nanohaloarchaea archaeon]|nr:hypothetical protein [Candidatus Nanohaloarchaea archaeon]
PNAEEVLGRPAYDSLSDVKEEIDIVDEGHDGRYLGSDENAVEIELGSYSRLVEVTGEELGHYVFHELIADELEPRSTLETATFNEAVANLCSRYFTDRLEHDFGIPYEPTIFIEENRKAFEDAVAALNTDYRRREQQHLGRIETMIEEDDPDWAAITQEADDLLSIPPDSGLDRFDSIHDTGYMASMFVHNLPTGTIERNKRSIRIIGQILAEHDEPEGREKAVIEAYETPVTSYVPRKIRDAGSPFLAEDDYLAVRYEILHNGPVGHVTLEDLREQQLRYHATDILEQAVKEAVEEGQETIETYLEDLETADQSKLLLDAVDGERYGYDHEVAGPYSSYMDFPHNVGGKMAEDMYDAGVDPVEVVDDPEPYIEQCRERLEQAVRDWLTFVD